MTVILEILYRSELQYKNTCPAHSMRFWTHKLSIQVYVIRSSKMIATYAAYDAVVHEVSVRFSPAPSHLVEN